MKTRRVNIARSIEISANFDAEVAERIKAKSQNTKPENGLSQIEDIKARLANDGNEAVGSTPEEFTAYIAAEIPKWARVIKRSGARME